GPSSCRQRSGRTPACTSGCKRSSPPIAIRSCRCPRSVSPRESEPDQGCTGNRRSVLVPSLLVLGNLNARDTIASFRRFQPSEEEHGCPLCWPSLASRNCRQDGK